MSSILYTAQALTLILLSLILSIGILLCIQILLSIISEFLGSYPSYVYFKTKYEMFMSSILTNIKKLWS